MPKIRNFSLPQEITDELVRSVQFVPENYLTLWGREFLPGGFTRPDTIRERLAARIRGEGTLDPKVVDMLRMGAVLGDLVATLSLSALQLLYAPLILLCKRESVLAAALLDEREEVHKWAAETALKPPAPEFERAEEVAENLLYDYLQNRLLDPLGFMLEIPGEEPADKAETAAELADLKEGIVKNLSETAAEQRRTIDRLNSELHQQKQRHLAKLKEQSEAAERDKKSLRAEISNLQKQAASLRKENQALDECFKELSQRLEQAIAQGVREQTSALVRKWLVEPLALEAALPEAGSKDLLERTEQVLTAQAQHDRHSGNRMELERRLEQLRQARDRAQTALRTALTPIAELRPLLTDLDTEIARLEKLLAGAKPTALVPGRLLDSINTAGTWEEVRGCSQLVDQLAEFRILTSEEVRNLYHAIQRKFSLLEETNKAKNPDGDNGWSLRDTLYRNKAALLVLDGHNLLFNLTDIFLPDFENNHPGRKARQRLVELVANLVRPRPNVRTIICFDGPEGASIKVAPNLEVVYSGGQGRNRADELIVSHLQFKDLTSLEQKVFVVSDDREVRRGILRTGARFVPNDLFAVFLYDFKCL